MFRTIIYIIFAYWLYQQLLHIDLTPIVNSIDDYLNEVAYAFEKMMEKIKQ